MDDDRCENRGTSAGQHVRCVRKAGHKGMCKPEPWTPPPEQSHVRATAIHFQAEGLDPRLMGAVAGKMLSMFMAPSDEREQMRRDSEDLLAEYAHAQARKLTAKKKKGSP